MISKTTITCLLVPLFLLFGCSNINTNPCPSFKDVRRCVLQRTGNTIYWGHNSDDHCNVRCCIDQLLSDELVLDQVIQITLLNNQRLQAIYERLGIAQAELVQAGLFKNPVIDFSFRYDKPFGADQVIEAGLVQNLLDILLIPLKKKMAQSELEMVKIQITGDVLEVIAEVKKAFYSLQAAEQALILRRQIQDAADVAVDAATRLYEAGNTTNLDLLVECSLFEQAKIEVLTSKMQVMEAKETLNVLMGLWGCQADWNIGAHLIPIPEHVTEFSEIERCAATKSLDLQHARRHICTTAARSGIDVAEMIFPELGLGIDSEREVDGNWFVGPQVAIGLPLFDFGHARTARGRAELRKLCHEYAALEVEVRSAARSAYSRLCIAQQQSLGFEKVLRPLAEEITAETLLQLNAMQVGIFDILHAKLQEIELKLKGIMAYRDYWIAQTELDLLLNGRMFHQLNRKYQ